MRLRCFTIGALLLAILALAMYAMVDRTLATGVTLSIVGGERAYSEGADISCVLSNGTSGVISFFRVYDDGFGYSLERRENDNWMPSGTTWCATGRDIVQLNKAETYSFKAQIPLDHYKRRISVEYWDGEPLLSAPKNVKSRQFVFSPDSYRKNIAISRKTRPK